MSKTVSKGKHYTPYEKKLFLDILKQYNHVIEAKKTNAVTLREKEIAWKEIVRKYNTSCNITQERTEHQLKKLWTNLKQTQRNIITKEKQARFMTGGGPEVLSDQIDPDIAAIAPDIMTSAPVIFTSNLEVNECVDRNEQLLDMVDSGNETFSNAVINEVIPRTSSTFEQVTEHFEEINESEKEQTEGIDASSTMIHNEHNVPSSVSITPCSRKRKRVNDEETLLRIERLEKIICNEEILSDMKKKHEKRMMEMKELYELAKYKQELRAVTATADLAELLLRKEIEKTEKKHN